MTRWLLRGLKRPSRPSMPISKRAKASPGRALGAVMSNPRAQDARGHASSIRDRNGGHYLGGPRPTEASYSPLMQQALSHRDVHGDAGVVSSCVSRPCSGGWYCSLTPDHIPGAKPVPSCSHSTTSLRAQRRMPVLIPATPATPHGEGLCRRARVLPLPWGKCAMHKRMRRQPTALPLEAAMRGLGRWV